MNGWLKRCSGLGWVGPSLIRRGDTKMHTPADGHVGREERAEAEAAVCVVAAEEEAEHVGVAFLVDHGERGGGPPGRLRHGPVW